MTIVVTAKVTDGIVLAADSAATFFNPGSGHPIKIYNHANKIFNLRKVWPIGSMVYGAGGIGAASVETLSKDLRARFTDPGDTKYNLDKESYTVEEVAKKARTFLYEERYKVAFPSGADQFYMGYRVCGYSAKAELPEIWEFCIVGADCAEPVRIQAQEEFGARWAGENEALDRLLLGASQSVKKVFMDRGASSDEAEKFYLETVQQAGLSMIMPAMPIQDAINVAKYLVETAARFAKYGMRPETIGGPVEVAAITKHEGFKWIERKHYYPADLNRETDHGR